MCSSTKEECATCSDFIWSNRLISSHSLYYWRRVQMASLLVPLMALLTFSFSPQPEAQIAKTLALTPEIVLRDQYRQVKQRPQFETALQHLISSVKSLDHFKETLGQNPGFFIKITTPPAVFVATKVFFFVFFLPKHDNSPTLTKLFLCLNHLARP